MSWFRKRKHQFRGVLAFLHPQFLHYSQLAAVLLLTAFHPRRTSYVGLTIIFWISG